MTEATLLLDRIYAHEAAQPDRVLMTQPIGDGKTVDITWGQALDQARRMAAHLRSLKLPPGARIAMLAKNSAHFVLAEIAIWMAGGTTVAIFPTETADNVRYVLGHSEASLLFVGKLDTWELQRPGIPESLPRIALPMSALVGVAGVAGVDAWDAIVARTAPLTGRPSRAADDLAMILYTSGSTGRPKGVMHTFGTIARRTAAVEKDPVAQMPDGVPKRALSYLPLAHAYERAVLSCQGLHDGDSHLFFTESAATFMDDLRRARPTFFCSVPRLWQKFQQGVLAAVPADKLEAMLGDPASAPAVRRKVLTDLGLDEVRIAVSGSAPIAPSLLQWYRKLGLNVIEGYAMTEDFCLSHRTSPGFEEPGYVGVAAVGVEVRIAEDGEVLVKSPGAMTGYYKEPELNAEIFTADGFFHTGDLGERRPDGQLRITGRKKEIFKTAKGKYVAPAPIETRIDAHAMVEMSMVTGTGHPAPIGLVMLNETLQPRLGDPAFRAQVDDELGKLLRETNDVLAPHEKLHALVIAPERWTMENGCLTPTMKLKRSRIESGLAASLGAWYTQPGPVIWG